MDINDQIAITLDEAAVLLSVSRRTIYRLAKDNKLKIVRITKDTPRILLQDLKSYVANCASQMPEEGRPPEQSSEGPEYKISKEMHRASFG